MAEVSRTSIKLRWWSKLCKQVITYNLKNTIQKHVGLFLILDCISYWEKLNNTEYIFLIAGRNSYYAKRCLNTNSISCHSLSLGTGWVSQNWYLCFVASSMLFAGPWQESSSMALWMSCSFWMGKPGFCTRNTHKLWTSPCMWDNKVNK